MSIAVIGMSGRFPGANGLDEFWRNLQNGVHSISTFSENDVIGEGLDRKTMDSPHYVKAGGALEGIEFFDAAFFGYSPAEAAIIDPQQRIFLECAWQALEQAGYVSNDHPYRVGVFAGCGSSLYLINNVLRSTNLSDAGRAFQAVIGNDKDFLTTRVSYKLNLTGPSVTVQTACSTSLVAIHLACQSLLNHECDIALSGGVTIRVPQKTGYQYYEGGINSPDGYCRAFDAQARGTVGGNGAGVVTLKRLEDAVADRDFIWAVIKGSAVNNDGSAKVGFTAPSVNGQAQVIAEALSVAQCDPKTIRYVEAHGTGTRLGDPIEIAALKKVFDAGKHNEASCGIGSVKTNIGHLDTAAGVAGLIKAVLLLYHRRIPPSLHFSEPNPELHLNGTSFYIHAALTDWEEAGDPRRAAVSSFGIGGTNAHVVLEEPPPPQVLGAARAVQLVLLSAKTRSALQANAANLIQYLKAHPDAELADVAYTLHCGRRMFTHRLACVCKDREVAIERLSNATAAQCDDGGTTVFMFPGQGTQYVNMTAGIYRTEPFFREQVDRCCSFIQARGGLDLRRILFPPEDEEKTAAARLRDTEVTQLALFTIEFALGQLLMKWGVRPGGMIGHSIGEYVAACLSGVFTLEDALTLIVFRGRFMQSLAPGGMLAVALSEDEVLPLLPETVSIAAVNSSRSCVLSGPLDRIDEFAVRCSSAGIPFQHLQTSHAFHSPCVEPLLQPFADIVAGVKRNSPAIPWISNVTGTWITDEEATAPSYWARHLRQTVRFADGVEQLVKGPARFLLEVGPGRSLRTAVKQAPGINGKHVVLSLVRHRDDKHSDLPFLLGTLGEMWAQGGFVDGGGFYEGQQRNRLPLPAYSFDRTRHWIEPKGQAPAYEAAIPGLERADIQDWFFVPSWKRSDLECGLSSEQIATRRYLIFEDRQGIGALLRQKLERTGLEVVRAFVSDSFEVHGRDSYSLDPGDSRQYRALLDHLRRDGFVPSDIVHCWTLDLAHDRDDRIIAYHRSQQVGLYSVLSLIQAAEAEFPSRSLRLLVVSSNVHEVIGTERIAPAQATLLGACRAIPYEYPNVSCRNVDIGLRDRSPREQDWLAEVLAAELYNPQTEYVVAYRHRHRWVQTFERKQTPSGGETKLRRGGVYLITGGLGGIGSTIAKYLAETLQAKLVLTGKSPLPPQADWDQLPAASDGTNDVAERIARIREIEQAGGEVLFVRADVANLKEMRGVMRQATSKFGRIHGVIHAAGLAEGGLSQIKTREAMDRVLGPKTIGTLVLDKVLRGSSLDFFIMCSSITAITGGVGQFDYCAANAFQDSFAHAKRRYGFPVCSINWDAWRKRGMAADARVPRQLETFKSQQLQYAISLAEGIEAFRRVLSFNDAQILISTVDLRARMSSIRAESTPVEDEIRKPSVSELEARVNVREDYVEPSTSLEQDIAAIWEDVLKTKPIGTHDNFFELGGHSLLLMTVAAELFKAYYVKIPLQALIESPTVAGVAQLVEEAALQEVEAMEEEDKRIIP